MTRRILIAEIQAAVAAATGVSRREQCARRGDRQVIRGRFAAIWLASQLTNATLVGIGRRFGDRDHSTISAALKRVPELREEDEELDFLIARLARQLRGEAAAPAVAASEIQLAFLDGPLFDLACPEPGRRVAA